MFLLQQELVLLVVILQVVLIQECDAIDYLTMASTGIAGRDFGDLVNGVRLFNGGMSCNSTTRGIWIGGSDPSSGTTHMDSITIATLGDSTDFGNCTQSNGGWGGL